MNSVAPVARIALIAALALLAACQRTSEPPPTSIGGISIGMSVDAYRDVAHKPPGFQLGGVSGVPNAVFSNGKLDRFDWSFPTMKYMTVRGWFAANYPQLKCETAMGFEVCTVGRTLYLAEGQRGGPGSHVWLERKRD
jgi:hypothetical protein